MICDFLKEFDDFVHLSFAGEMGVIHDDRIFRLAERRFGIKMIQIQKNLMILMNKLKI